MLRGVHRGYRLCPSAVTTLIDRTLSRAAVLSVQPSDSAAGQSSDAGHRGNARVVASPYVDVAALNHPGVIPASATATLRSRSTTAPLHRGHVEHQPVLAHSVAQRLRGRLP